MIFCLKAIYLRLVDINCLTKIMGYGATLTNSFQLFYLKYESMLDH